MLIYEKRREEHKKLIKTMRPYLKVHGFVHCGQKWLLHTTCKDCGLDSRKPPVQLMSFDCICKRGAKIASKQKSSTKRINEICKLAKVKLLEPYTTMNTATLVQCLVCSHKWSAYFGNLRKGHACNKCGDVKRLATNLERYGDPNSKAAKRKKKRKEATMMTRFGVKHALQNKELFEKNLDTAFAWKEYKLGQRTVKIQGFEPKALDWILAKGIKPNQIVCGRGAKVPSIRYNFEKSKDLIYFPDIWIPHLNRIVEVKSDHTLIASLERNLAKRKAVLKAGYDFIFIVMNKNGTRMSAKSVEALIRQTRS